MMMFDKPQRCVSKALRQSAKGQSCALRGPWCNHNDETVVLCHVRMFGRSGVNTKPLDFHAFYGCSDCHLHEQDIDAGEIFRAVMETQERMYNAGLITIKGA